MPHLIKQFLLTRCKNKSVKHACDNILISLNLFLDGNRLVEWIFVMDMQCEALSESHKTRTNMFLSRISPQNQINQKQFFLSIVKYS